LRRAVADATTAPEQELLLLVEGGGAVGELAATADFEIEAGGGVAVLLPLLPEQAASRPPPSRHAPRTEMAAAAPR
jgi:hypothetical protein